MRYIESTLLKDERVVYWTRPHWIIFTNTGIYLLAVILILLYGPALGLGNFNLFDMQASHLLALLLFLFTIYAAIKATITFYTSEYGVTNRRVLIKVGWIRRDSLELFLDKVEAIRVDQSIPGRILGYGTLIVVGTGGSHDPFRYVPQPLKFRKIVQQQIDLDERARAAHYGKDNS